MNLFDKLIRVCIILVALVDVTSRATLINPIFSFWGGQKKEPELGEQLLVQRLTKNSKVRSLSSYGST